MGITERSSAQEALHASEERFRNLVETTSDWVWEVDENCVYTYVSPKVRDILGYEPDQVLGKTPFHLMPADEAARISAIFNSAVSSRKPFTALENINLHKDGQPVILETSGVPFFDRDGNFRGYHGIDRDRTAHKRAEEALRTSEAFLRLVLESIPAQICYIDSEERYRFANRRYATRFGHTADDITGKRVNELLEPLLYNTLRGYIARALAGEELTFEFVRKGSGEEERQLLCTYVPHIAGNKNILGFFALLEDVTDRKHLEERLRQSQKLEAVGSLAGGVAHDFNNLLTVITGYSALVLARLGKDDPLVQEIEEINRAADRAASLTRQLLAFSRKQILQPKVLDLNLVVSGMDQMLRRLVGEDIELVTTLGPDIGRVKTDPGQMGQIIMNLAANARDAMPGGGTLTITTRNIEIDEVGARRENAPPPGEYVMLSVADTGHGMDAKTKNHLFEPFFTTKKPGKGTGLGLSTVYGIVEQSGGHIRVSSEPGMGSTFSIYLPRIEQPADAEQAPAAAHKPAGGRETILLVEDDGAVRKMVHRALSKQGYEVLQAAGGEEALGLSDGRQGQIDLLITDVVMPHISGRQLAQRLASIRKEMRVLYMSGYADDALGHYGILDASTNFLQKPFTPDVMIRKVRELLDR